MSRKPVSPTGLLSRFPRRVELPATSETDQWAGQGLPRARCLGETARLLVVIKPREDDVSDAVQQAPGLWRPDLQRHDLSVPGREVIQNRVEIAPEARHKHPGEEIIHVLEESLEYQIDGMPRGPTMPATPCSSRPRPTMR